jgi:hypothetical protein
VSFITYIHNHGPDTEVQTYIRPKNVQKEQNFGVFMEFVKPNVLMVQGRYLGMISSQGLYSIFKRLIIIWINTNTMHNRMKLFFFSHAVTACLNLFVNI